MRTLKDAKERYDRMEIPQELQDLERETFLQIIAGEKPLDYFDTFVVKWYENGGKELTESIERNIR